MIMMKVKMIMMIVKMIMMVMILVNDEGDEDADSHIHLYSRQ